MAETTQKTVARQAYTIVAPLGTTVYAKNEDGTKGQVLLTTTQPQQNYIAISEETIIDSTGEYTHQASGFSLATSGGTGGGTTQEITILNPYVQNDDVHMRITSDVSGNYAFSIYQEGTKTLSCIDLTDFPEIKVEGINIGVGGAYFGGHVTLNNGCTVNTAPVHPNDPMRKGDIDALIWTGTAEQWNALTSEQQASYKVEMITA